MNIKNYYHATRTPWGELFYLSAWKHLNFHNKKILDFGSGFGITANHLAENNHVTAIEPNSDILKFTVSDHKYIQIIGGEEQLTLIPDNTFDVIICHNVMEYIDDRNQLITEFHRIMKKDGILSIIKHNRLGTVMHKAVFENDIDGALDSIARKNVFSQNFGKINYFTSEDLKNWCGNQFSIESFYGMRIFYALQSNEFKSKADWKENIFKLECAVEEIPEFREVAFYHHIILRNC